MPASNGKIINCSNCNTPKYFPLNRIERSKHLFCSVDCANEFQSRNKVAFICKTCSSIFKVSPSYLTKAEKNNHTIQYCNIKCRDKDTARMTEKAQLMNLAQLEKNGLNKLELHGREWLQGLGFILGVDFFEQVTLFGKFTVDIFFPREKLIVQFDGNYWHSKPKRVKLDISQDAYLQKCGYKVFRVTDTSFKQNNIEEINNYTSRFISALIRVGANKIVFM